MGSIEGVTVVIRSVKERTEKLCKQLILQQGISEENVIIIQERPFSRAMQVGYQLGIDRNLDWTLYVDADVLLRDGAIKEMLKMVKKMPSKTMGISGELLDKLIGKRRTAGNHFFQTKFLHKLIENILPYEIENIRPESTIIKKLQREGYTYHKVDLFVGLHDFEQHFHDIARKAFTHSKKHSHLMSEFVSYWIRSAKHDPDYKAALFGLSKGVMHFGDVKINSENFSQIYKEAENLFGRKSGDISEFKIKSAADVLSEMENDQNYFKPNNLLITRNKKIFRTEFNSMSYIELMKHLALKLAGSFKK